MSGVDDHYNQHLGPVYAWMVGGIDSAVERGIAELNAMNIPPSNGGIAVDLGAGFGMHTIPLARRGYQIIAIDSCAVLLGELREQRRELPIHIVRDDLQAFPKHLLDRPELILCMGDTLLHLPETLSVERLIGSVSDQLSAGGRFVATFRDFTNALTEENRFIAVRSDESRILTCFLEYEPAHVVVHDLLHEREGPAWKLNVSSYRKLRLSPAWITGCLEEHGFEVDCDTAPSGMIRVVASRR